MQKLVLVACLSGLYGCTTEAPVPGDDDLVGGWVVEFVGDRPVVDMSPAVIEFADGNRVGGNASCNRFMGSYSLTEGKLAFSRLGATRMMCPPALIEQEVRFLASMQEVAQVALPDGVLELRDSDGKTVIRASRPDTAK